MKVKLSRAVGDNPAGAELEIKDQTVLEAWERLGVIEGSGSDISKMKLEDLKALADKKELPKEEWENLKKEDLVTYLKDK
ncbi:hypothetical protein [Chryseobacterium sp.]|uniref:hypothetical protein n=1 Tax=Chryseobacterium sp. TaxID=1871047 RepID=UPI00321A5AAC